MVYESFSLVRERAIKRVCEKEKISETSCRAIIHEVDSFSTLNEEAEYWLNEKDKKITDKRVEILIKACDDAMEETTENIEEEEY